MPETNKSLSVVIAGFERNEAAIVQALDSSDPELRCVALGAALRSTLLNDQMLRPFLSDVSNDVRYRAVELAARVPGRKNLVDDLVGLLTQPDLAEVTAFVLGELGEPSTTVNRALCLQAESHPNPLARESAVAALGALEIGRASILAATEDIATVRRRAILSLAAFDGAEVDQALQKALSDRDWQVRQAAEDLLNIGATPADESE